MRTFKTAWFERAARKALIEDDDLCDAIRAVARGQADDLGGGVFKKRLDRNRHRSIILAKGGKTWIYQYLFAKRDRANIKSTQLDDFRILARGFAALRPDQLDRLVLAGDLVEICHDDG